MVTGTLIQKLPVESGTGANGPWAKQVFILETYGQYPKKIAIEAWGEKQTIVVNTPIGAKMSVEVNIESREYNGRWFTTLKLWKIDSGSMPVVNQQSGSPAPIVGNPAPNTVANTPIPGDLPF